MARSSSAGSFETVNPEWLYAIVAPTPVYLDPQPGERWLAHTGGTTFMLLTSGLVVRVLNEALDQGLQVVATHRATVKSLVFQRINGVVTSLPAKIEHA